MKKSKKKAKAPASANGKRGKSSIKAAVPATSGGVSKAATGLHLDISGPRVSQLIAEGIFKALPNGKLDLAPTRIAYIRYLRDARASNTKTAAATRVQDARAREIELRMAKDAGTLYAAEDVEAAIADILGTYRSELTGVPAASTRDLTVRATIEKHLNDAIERARASFEKLRDDLRSGREVSLEGEETDA